MLAPLRGPASSGLKKTLGQAQSDRNVRRQSRKLWLPLLLLTIYDSLLLVQQIGFDRSAFVASRHKVAGQSKNKESSKCSIHDEGLLEHPIKN